MKFYLFSFTCVCILASCTQNENTNDRYQSKLPVRDSETELIIEEEPTSPTKTDKLTKEAFLDFIPDGYTVKDWKTGNLNRDDQDDIVIILEKESSETEAVNANDAQGGAAASGSPAINEEKRPVLLLTRNSNGNLKLAGRNDNVVLCSDCGGVLGDPYSAITIKNGYFSIEHYGGSNWRWTRIIIFKYSEQNKTWYLHKDGGDSYHTSNPDEINSKVLSKKDFGTIKFEDYDSSMFDF